MNFWNQLSNNLFKANKSTRAKDEICSMLKIKIPEQCQCCSLNISLNRSSVFIATLNKQLLLGFWSELF